MSTRSGLVRLKHDGVMNLFLFRRQQASFSTALQALFNEGKLEPLLGEQAKQAGPVEFAPWAVSVSRVSR